VLLLLVVLLLLLWHRWLLILVLLLQSPQQHTPLLLLLPLLPHEAQQLHVGLLYCWMVTHLNCCAHLHLYRGGAGRQLLTWDPPAHSTRAPLLL
jgi:hypothetical protein